MPVVVDASALLCLAFDDEGVPYGAALVDAIREEGAVSPTILWYELRNALIVNERRKRITSERSAAFIALIGELPLALQPLPSDAGVMDLARRRKLSVYEASYLELSLREGFPLATLDESLREAARRIKVPVWSVPGS